MILPLTKKIDLFPLNYIATDDVLWVVGYYVFCQIIENPNDCFDISNYLQFTTCNTRSSNIQLVHTRSSNNSSRHFYFNCLPQLWNALPPINLDLPIYLIKSQLKSFLWNRFLLNFDSNNYCSYHFLCPCNSCMSIPYVRLWF